MVGKTLNVQKLKNQNLVRRFVLGGSGKNDFGSNPGIGEDFEKERVGEAAVDEVNFLSAGAESVEGGGHFGNHSSSDGSVFEIGGCFFLVEGRDESFGFFGVVHETWDIG